MQSGSRSFGRSTSRASGVLALFFALVLGSGEASAQKPTSSTTEYSPYEKEAIDIALQDLKLEIDPHPQGKRVGKIWTVRLDVLEPRDPGPELLKPVPIVSPAGKYVTKPMLNWIHVLTKPYIIRRELLVRENETYEQVLVDETARNMRSRMPVSLVVIVPVRRAATKAPPPPSSPPPAPPPPPADATGDEASVSAAPPAEPDRPEPTVGAATEADAVDLLVITKDIWSLRLSFDTAVTKGGLENLLIVPQETNFLGLHHVAQTRFQLRPETYSLGVGYKVPRFGYSWIGAAAAASITINKRESSPEGSAISISTGQSLYSTKAEWAWDADIGYAVGVARRYSNAQVFLFDSRATPGVRDNIPWQYKTRSLAGSASATRSFGWGFKNNFSLSFNASTGDNETFDLSRYDPRAVADFVRRALPTSESRVYPAVSWHTFRTDFLRTLDINTLGLQEDYRVGHDISATFYPVSKALGSTRDIIGLSTKWGYSQAVGDGLVGASFSTFAEVSEGVITDGAVGGSFGAVTPRFKVGRIVMNTSINNRYRNYLNAQAFLGGEDRLRGYPTAFFVGKDTVLFNIEYRSRAIEILKAQIGGVLFYDTGDAATGLDNLHAKQSVGFGLRTLFPQVNRLVFRIDFAFPLNRGPFPESGVPGLVDPFGFFFTFDQAFAP